MRQIARFNLLYIQRKETAACCNADSLGKEYAYSTNETKFRSESE